MSDNPAVKYAKSFTFRREVECILQGECSTPQECISRTEHFHDHLRTYSREPTYYCGSEAEISRFMELVRKEGDANGTRAMEFNGTNNLGTSFVTYDVVKIQPKDNLKKG